MKRLKLTGNENFIKLSDKLFMLGENIFYYKIERNLKHNRCHYCSLDPNKCIIRTTGLLSSEYCVCFVVRSESQNYINSKDYAGMYIKHIDRKSLFSDLTYRRYSVFHRLETPWTLSVI